MSLPVYSFRLYCSLVKTTGLLPEHTISTFAHVAGRRVRSGLGEHVEQIPDVPTEGPPAESFSPERTNRLGEKRFGEGAPVPVPFRPFLQSGDVAFAQTVNKPGLVHSAQRGVGYNEVELLTRIASHSCNPSNFNISACAVSCRFSASFWMPPALRWHPPRKTRILRGGV